MLAGVGMFISGCSLLILLSPTYEEFQKIELPDNRVVVVYSEGVMAEPPHLLHCDIIVNGEPQITHSGRGSGFLMVGGERRPLVRFRVVTDHSGDVVALVDGINVVLIYDFANGELWPDSQVRGWAEFEIGKRLYRIINSADSLLVCRGLDEYRRGWIPSPNRKRFAESRWDVHKMNGVHYADVRIRIVDDKDGSVCVIQTDPLVELFESLSLQWAVGWLGDDIVIYISPLYRVHAWRLAADGSYTKLPEPLAPEVEARARDVWKRRYPFATRSP